ncbi:hypothetical protein MKW98_030852 [Papaver atlanticum]|uniref:Uncharacterized protein n=1 Tax=Papaver atlanticum TaxID=357466 RepID=A0AAD4X729_9MAGN|nr:hypothetical protein MKW98_030852 [Papaver atlanticum]
MEDDSLKQEENLTAEFGQKLQIWGVETLRPNQLVFHCVVQCCGVGVHTVLEIYQAASIVLHFGHNKSSIRCRTHEDGRRSLEVHGNPSISCVYTLLNISMIKQYGGLSTLVSMSKIITVGAF